MATSGSANFSTSRDELVKYALLNVGAIGEGETPSSTQYTNGAFLLNLIVKAWAADGMPLWATNQTSFSVSESVASYTIGNSATVSVVGRPHRLINAFIRDETDDTDTPLEILSRQEYEGLSAKTQEGTPSQIYYDPRGGSTTTGILYLWPVPDETAGDDLTVYVTYQRPFEDFDSSSDEPDFPPEWFMPLLWELSWALAPSYGVSIQERNLWRTEAMMLKKAALDFDVEPVSVYVQPDERF